MSVVREPSRLPYFRNIDSDILSFQNTGGKFLEIVRRVAIHREVGSLHDEPQKSLVVVVIEWQTTNHLYNRYFI